MPAGAKKSAAAGTKSLDTESFGADQCSKEVAIASELMVAQAEVTAKATAAALLPILDELRLKLSKQGREISVLKSKEKSAAEVTVKQAETERGRQFALVRLASEGGKASDKRRMSLRVCVAVCTHMYVPSTMHARIHIYTHTHTRTCSQMYMVRLCHIKRTGISEQQHRRESRGSRTTLLFCSTDYNPKKAKSLLAHA